jgi:hypothetical protein
VIPIENSYYFTFSPQNLDYPGSISIPCIVGNIKLERVLCDSGVSLNLMHLSLSKRILKFGELLPTSMEVQIFDKTRAHQLA